MSDSSWFFFFIFSPANKICFIEQLIWNSNVKVVVRPFPTWRQFNSPNDIHNVYNNKGRHLETFYSKMHFHFCREIYHKTFRHRAIDNKKKMEKPDVVKLFNFQFFLSLNYLNFSSILVLFHSFPSFWEIIFIE